MGAQEKKEYCLNCERHGSKEELLLIPAREGRRQHLYCPQCEREYACDNNGKMKKARSMVSY
jgi:hypothetical protein